MGTLTGGLAHELKNPLSTVQLNLQLLGEDLLPENPAYSRLTSRLHTVQKETSRLRDILDDFLRFAGRMELMRKPTDLNVMLEELVDFFSPQAQLQRVQLRLQKSTEPVMAQVDERLTAIKQEFETTKARYLPLITSSEERALFVNTRGGRITRQGFWFILKGYARAVGEGVRITPHTLRHSFAAHKLGGGLPLTNLQQMLGHSAPSSTRIYSAFTTEERPRPGQKKGSISPSL